MSKSTQNPNGGKKIKIREGVKEFAEKNMKEYRKENGYSKSEKKECKRAYTQFLLSNLPDVIEFLINYGHINAENVQKVKKNCIRKITDPDFVKALQKDLKNGNRIDNIELLPIIIREISLSTKKANDELLANDPNSKIYDISDVTDLTELILKKKFKKMEKAGIDKAIAYDVLSVIPTKVALERSFWHRFRMLYDTLYIHAKTKDIPLNDIVKLIIPKGYISAFITFALLERKEKFIKLNDKQKEFYLLVTNWCFDTMENDMSNKERKDILMTYINSRMRDDKNNRDGNRRYSLITLLSTDPNEDVLYENLSKSINEIIAKNEINKKYLG